MSFSKAKFVFAKENINGVVLEPGNLLKRNFKDDTEKIAVVVVLVDKKKHQW